MESTAVIADIAAADFDQRVVQASHDRPVVVDFWAPWCGPCHHLSPLLERVAQRYADDVDVVKLNVDTAPDIARRFQIQGIPAVKAFKGGAVAAEFVGVQPETSITQFFDGLAPSPADRLVAQAAALDGEAAEPLLRQALETDRTHAGAIVALADLELARGGSAQARVLLERVPSDPRARRLLARLALAEEGAEDLDALQVAARSGDAAARLRLGRSLAAADRHAEALEVLVQAVTDPAVGDDARAAVLSIFELLGAEHELVRVWRPKLAAALF